MIPGGRGGGQTASTQPAHERNNMLDSIERITRECEIYFSLAVSQTGLFSASCSSDSFTAHIFTSTLNLSSQQTIPDL